MEPHPRSAKASKVRRIKGQLHTDGKYNGASSTMRLFLTSDQANSNRLLLHETRHWIQDVTDMYPAERTARGRFVELFRGMRHMPVQLAFTVAAPVLGYGVYEVTHDATTAAVCAGTILAFTGITLPLESSVMHTAWERDAYQFERDPAVLQAYGSIITHQAV